jgi:hypothetical protein
MSHGLLAQPIAGGTAVARRVGNQQRAAATRSAFTVAKTAGSVGFTL